MKREQKVLTILAAACMAFGAISAQATAYAAPSTAYAEPVSFQQVQLGNYIDDDTPAVAQKAEKNTTLSSGRKVIKKSSAKSTTATVKKSSAKPTEQTTEKSTTLSSGKKVIKKSTKGTTQKTTSTAKVISKSGRKVIAKK